MSIDQLKSDLKDIGERLTQDPPSTSSSLVSFLQDNLLPWLDSLTDETMEMDESIESMVHQSDDILHPESAGVFAAIIMAGLKLATELAHRVGNDGRLLRAIAEFRDLALQGRALLEEITLPDEEEEEEDDDDDDAEDDTSGTPAGESKPTP